MPIVELTSEEKDTLREFLIKQITARRDHAFRRQDLDGVLSGGLFRLLKFHHPAIARKLKNRAGLVAEADALEFVINVGHGGSRRGVVTWESIDLRPDDRARA